jgi:hypothetical protein
MDGSGRGKFQPSLIRNTSHRLSLDCRPTRRSVELPMPERRSLDAGYGSYLADQGRSGTAAVVMPMRPGSEVSSRSRRSSVDSSALWQTLQQQQQQQQLSAVQQVAALLQGSGSQPSPQLLQCAMQELAQQLVQQPQPLTSATAALDMLAALQAQQAAQQCEREAAAASFLQATSQQQNLSDPALSSFLAPPSAARPPAGPPAANPSTDLLAAMCQILQQQEQQQEQQALALGLQPQLLLPFCRPGLPEQAQQAMPTSGSWALPPTGYTPMGTAHSSASNGMLQGVQGRQSLDWGSGGAWGEEPDRCAALAPAAGTASTTPARVCIAMPAGACTRCTLLLDMDGHDPMPVGLRTVMAWC